MSTRALSPGTVVHRRYRVERVLGEGGFGVTYMVYDMKENRISAMKEYFPLEIADRRPGSMEVVPRPDKQDIYNRFKDTFLQEAQTIYNYSGHPNIISVYHLFNNENGTAYYVMEYINGVDLSKLLTQNGQRIDWEVLKPIVAQIVSALTKVHASNVIHCDISPDNIFILNGGTAKLIDFGAAKNVANKSTIMLLKRGFAPPEQSTANGRLGPWTDIYALAVTVYRAITGSMPPAAEDRVKNDETCWPSEMGIPIPGPYWEQALRRGMALRVEDRFQTATDFWKALSGEFTTPADTRYMTYPQDPVHPVNATQGYIRNQNGYPLQGNGYPPQGNGYPPQGNGYPPQGNGYPPQGNGYPPQGNGYPPQGNGYPPQGNGYNNQGNGYYPNNNSGYPPQYNTPQHNYYQQKSRYQPILECIRGAYSSAKIPISGEIVMGTDRTCCNLPFQPKTPGISRKHLRIWPDKGRVLVMDMGSSYGTYLDKQRLAPHKIYILPYGVQISIGEYQTFRVLPPNGEETQQLHR